MCLKEIGWKGVDGLMWFRKGKMVISCEGGKKPSRSIRYMEFLDQLRNYLLFKRESTLRSYLINGSDVLKPEGSCDDDDLCAVTDAVEIKAMEVSVDI